MTISILSEIAAPVFLEKHTKPSFIGAPNPRVDRRALNPQCWEGSQGTSHEAQLGLAMVSRFLVVRMLFFKYALLLRATLPTIQTFDGGYKWSVRTFGNLDEEEEINYRFQKVGIGRAVLTQAVGQSVAYGIIVWGFFRPKVPDRHLDFQRFWGFCDRRVLRDV